MKYIELTVLTTQEGIEPVIALFDAAGIFEVTVHESKEVIEAEVSRLKGMHYCDFADAAELANKKGPSVCAYVAHLEENKALIAAVYEGVERLKRMGDIGLDLGPLEVLERLCDEEDWANNWKAFYKPLPIGKKLLIKPSWEPFQEDGGRTIIEMDPGMVFGTGTHPTTKLCMELLEGAAQKGEALLDIGTGSGILAVTGILLGMGRALCVDIDPVAKRTVQENMKLNGIESGRYDVLIGNMLKDKALQEKAGESAPFGIVLSNIVADVIIALVPNVRKWLKPGGAYIASGIIEERLFDVETAFTQNGLILDTVQIMEGWAAIQAHG